MRKSADNVDFLSFFPSAKPLGNKSLYRIIEGSGMSDIYSELKIMTQAAVNAINSYREDSEETTEDELKDTFSNIRSKRSEVITALENEYTQRNVLYSSLISATLANYYCNRINTSVESVNNISSVIDILQIGSDDSVFEELVRETSEKLLNYSTQTTLEDSDISTIQNYGIQFQSLFTTLISKLGYDESSTIEFEISDSDILNDGGKTYTLSSTGLSIPLYSAVETGEIFAIEDDVSSSGATKVFLFNHGMTCDSAFSIKMTEGSCLSSGTLLMDAKTYGRKNIIDADMCTLAFSLNPSTDDTNTGIVPMVGTSNETKYVFEDGSSSFPFIISTADDIYYKIFVDTANLTDAAKKKRNYYFANDITIYPASDKLFLNDDGLRKRKFPHGIYYGNGHTLTIRSNTSTAYIPRIGKSKVSLAVIVENAYDTSSNYSLFDGDGDTYDPKDSIFRLTITCSIGKDDDTSDTTNDDCRDNGSESIGLSKLPGLSYDLTMTRMESVDDIISNTAIGGKTEEDLLTGYLYLCEPDDGDFHEYLWIQDETSAVLFMYSTESGSMFRMYLTLSKTSEAIGNVSNEITFLTAIGDLGRLSEFDNAKTIDAVIDSMVEESESELSEAGSSSNIAKIKTVKFFGLSDYAIIASTLISNMDVMLTELEELARSRVSTMSSAISSYIAIESARSSTDSAYSDTYTSGLLSLFEYMTTIIGNINLDLDSSEDISLNGVSLSELTDEDIESLSDSLSGIFTEEQMQNLVDLINNARSGAIGVINSVISGAETTINSITDSIENTINWAKDIDKSELSEAGDAIATIASKAKTLAVNTMNACISGIEDLTEDIERISPFFNISTTAGEDLEESMNNLYEIFMTGELDSASDEYTQETGYSTRTDISSTFMPMPQYTRDFSSWRNMIDEYCEDGIYNLAMMYICQELGMNANEYFAFDTDVAEEDRDAFISGFNYAFRDSFSKKLWSTDIMKPYYLTILGYDSALRKDYGIRVFERAYDECLPTKLKQIVPAMSSFEKIDIRKFLNGRYSINNEEYAKLLRIAKMTLIERIFSDKSEIVSITKLIYDALISSDLTFKSLIVMDALESLIQTMMNIADNNETILSDSEAAELKNLLDTFPYDCEDIFTKYQAVYIFKYIKGNYMMYYLNFDPSKVEGYSSITTSDEYNDNALLLYNFLTNVDQAPYVISLTSEETETAITSWDSWISTIAAYCSSLWGNISSFTSEKIDDLLGMLSGTDYTDYEHTVKLTDDLFYSDEMSVEYTDENVVITVTSTDNASRTKEAGVSALSLLTTRSDSISINLGLDSKNILKCSIATDAVTYDTSGIKNAISQFSNISELEYDDDNHTVTVSRTYDDVIEMQGKPIIYTPEKDVNVVAVYVYAVPTVHIDSLQELFSTVYDRIFGN